MNPQPVRSIKAQLERYLMSEANCLAGYCSSAKFILSLTAPKSDVVVVQKKWFEELQRRVDRFDKLFAQLSVLKPASPKGGKKGKKC